MQTSHFLRRSRHIRFSPKFPNQILRTGTIDSGKCCVVCGKCVELIRDGQPTGCVVRNAKTYLNIIKRSKIGGNS